MNSLKYAHFTQSVSVFSDVKTLPALSCSYLSTLWRSSIISLFRLGSSPHQQQPHLCVCQCSDLSAAPQVHTKTCTVWPSAHRTNNFIHLRSLSASLFPFCRFAHFTRGGQQKSVIWWRAKWAFADEWWKIATKSLITGSNSPVEWFGTFWLVDLELIPFRGTAWKEIVEPHRNKVRESSVKTSRVGFKLEEILKSSCFRTLPGRISMLWYAHCCLADKAWK